MTGVVRHLTSVIGNALLRWDYAPCLVGALLLDFVAKASPGVPFDRLKDLGRV
jgi:hypothetical protein